MDEFSMAMADRLQAIHQTIENAIADLPDEALIWSPGQEMNTLAVLVVHAMGAERYWIGDVAGQEPSGRKREAEFKTASGTAADLVARSREILAHSHSVLKRMTSENLAEIRVAPASGRQVTVAWAILHALEHSALHAGHIEITRQMWAQRTDGGMKAYDTSAA